MGGGPNHSQRGERDESGPQSARRPTGLVMLADEDHSERARDPWLLEARQCVCIMVGGEKAGRLGHATTVYGKHVASTLMILAPAACLLPAPFRA